MPKKKSKAKKSQGLLRAWLFRLSAIAVVALAVLMVYLDAQVRAQFDGKKWQLPAKVYARSLSLYPGREVSAEQLLAELEWADYKPSAEALAPGSFARRGDDWIIYRRAFPFWDGEESALRLELDFSGKRLNRIVSAGRELPLVRLEPQSGSTTLYR